MTRSIEIGPVLDAFLAEGVHELADHVLDAALTDIDHTKQRRALRVSWRYSDMPTPLRLLLAGAVLAGAVGGGLLIGGALPDRDDPPTPPPASVGPGEPLGIEPAGTYTAERSASFGLAAGAYELVVQSPPGMQVLLARGPDGREILLGTIANSGNRATFSATDRCTGSGTYDWMLGENNFSLDLTVVGDSCADRASLLAGSWSRLTMRYPLTPGRRYSIPSDGSTYTFTVPIGFSDPASGGPEVAVELHVGTQGEHAIFAQTPNLDLFVIPMRVPTVYTDRCDTAKGRGDGPQTLEQFIAWNKATTGSTVADPVAITVDSYPAVYIDIASTDRCANGNDADEIYDGLGAGMSSRTWGIDLGDRVVMIGIHQPGPPWVALTEEQLAVATELVASLTVD